MELGNFHGAIEDATCWALLEIVQRHKENIHQGGGHSQASTLAFFDEVHDVQDVGGSGIVSGVTTCDA
jgi:hypothetical protein